MSVVEYHGGVVSPPFTKVDFTLTDTSGQPYSFAGQTDGHLTLLFFGYTKCLDECPLVMHTLSAAKRQLAPEDASRITVVLVSVDPVQDTPEVLKQWLGGIDLSFIGLTGTNDQVNAVLSAFGAPQSEIANNGPDQTEQYFINHFSGVFLFTQDNLAHLLYSPDVSASAYASDLTKLVKNGWVGS